MNRKLSIAGCAVALFSASLSGFAASEAVTIQAPTNTSTVSASPVIEDYTSYKFGDVANVKFNALLQGWSVANQNTTPKVANENWRLRRTELKLSGSALNAPKYFIMVDPAKLVLTQSSKTYTTTQMVQDFGLSYILVPGLELTAGQFKIPTTAEGLDSSAELPLPERSLVGRQFGDKREMGVKVGYKAGIFSVVSMVSSGRNVHTNGTGMFHDLDSRVEVSPVKDLSFGTFLVAGSDFDYSKKGRWGLNGRYRVGNAVARVEYSAGKDGGVQSHGVTAEAGYWLTEDLQTIARYDTFSPNQAFVGQGQAESLGVNYLLKTYRSKLQMAASALQNMSAVNGSPAIAKGANNQELTLVLQTAPPLSWSGAPKGTHDFAIICQLRHASCNPVAAWNGFLPSSMRCARSAAKAWVAPTGPAKAAHTACVCLKPCPVSIPASKSCPYARLCTMKIGFKG
ncbi:MAG: hypothetical protein HY074_10235 [Deltaproteobacteria bacterium]|nr:hypothetical protein [Deltaproteobacteria bacterium]